MAIIEVKKKLRIRVPSVPNYILTEKEDVKFHISEFTDEELEVIISKWKEALLKAAKNKLR